jgi:hypothetical protein
MGFSERDATEALRRTNNDVNHAVELLSSGKVWQADDAEFDLIAAAETEPAVREPTVFNNLDHRHRHPEGVADPFTTGLREGTLAEMVDSRVAMFTEMGFTSQQAEDALKRANGDVNEALNILTGGARGGSADGSDLY